MTKDEKDLIKITRPIKFRTLRKIINTIHNFFEKLFYKLERHLLNIEAKIGLIEHTTRSDCVETDGEVVTKNAGVIVTQNIMFNIQINRRKKEYQYIDQYSRKGKIIKDYSSCDKYLVYNAFPINIRLKIKDEFVKANKGTILEYHEPYYNLNEESAEKSMRVERFSFDLPKFESIGMKRIIDDYGYQKRELIFIEMDLTKDFNDKFRKYMNNKFKFMDYLYKIG